MLFGNEMNSSSFMTDMNANENDGPAAVVENVSEEVTEPTKKMTPMITAIQNEVVNPLNFLATHAHQLAEKIDTSAIPLRKIFSAPVHAVGMATSALASRVNSLIASSPDSVTMIQRSADQLSDSFGRISSALQDPKQVRSLVEMPVSMSKTAGSMLAAYVSQRFVQFGVMMHHLGQALLEIGEGIRAVGADIYGWSVGSKPLPEGNSITDFINALNLTRIMSPQVGMHLMEMAQLPPLSMEAVSA
jgi:cellobiose-specific phosphotransferase system component IIB